VTSKSITDLIAEQKRPEWIVPICLRGDISSEIVRLDSELVEIKQNTLDDRLIGNPEAVEIAGRIEALRKEADDSTIEVKLRGLPRKEWSKLVEKHPAEAGSNRDFGWSIFNDAVPACIVEPEMDAETLEKFLEGLTEGQWDLLVGGVHRVCAEDGRVPFSALASTALPSSAQRSEPPEPSA